MTDAVAPVLIDGAWGPSAGTSTGLIARSPLSGSELSRYPTSPWDEIDRALAAGQRAYRALAAMDDSPDRVAAFLDSYAARIESSAPDLVVLAAAETALPAEPRLADVELPRTTGQLRAAAAAARDRSWTRPTMSPAAGIASMHRPLPGVVVVFGPNNFPFAFNGIAGGDFAAAVATGHPVLAKANPGHPGVTRMLAEAADAAAVEAGLPAGMVQLVYDLAYADGERLVADRRVAATAYTGSRAAGLTLKAAADRAGRPIYLELSAVNPVVVLPGAVAARGDELAVELANSVLLGAGQFCTKPGLLLTTAGAHAERLQGGIGRVFAGAPAAVLLSERTGEHAAAAVSRLVAAGAAIAARGSARSDGAPSLPATLLHVDGRQFLAEPAALQEEAFGPACVMVVATDIDELDACVDALEGSLTGCIYTGPAREDEAAYTRLAPSLGRHVGRLLNDKVPTGVAVVPAMNHSGPYPASGHPGFTAVGIPASLERFTMLQCYDNVRDHRLPPELQAANPLGLQRLVDSAWTRSPMSDAPDDDV